MIAGVCKWQGLGLTVLYFRKLTSERSDGGEGGERSRAGSNGLIYLPHKERFQLKLQSCMKECITRTLLKLKYYPFKYHYFSKDINTDAFQLIFLIQ